MANAFDKQIKNRNFLSPIGFKFTLAKYPKISFFCNTAKIPELTLTNEAQYTYLKNLDVPGDIITYGDLQIQFLVDEDMTNYMAVHNWITGIGFPETAQQFKNLITNEDGLIDQKAVFSDGSLHILNSNYNPTAVVKFKDLYPYSLTSLEFDATQKDIQYFTATVSFKYTIYNILDNNNKPL